MAADDQPILVVGGGIGGLAAALALRNTGRAVAVYERASAYGEAGAGLTLTPPGLRALAALGVLPAIIAASDNVARTAFLDHATGALIRLSESRAAADGSGVDTDETRVIHRADCHAILLDAARAAGVDFHAGAEMRSLDQDADGVRVGFGDGRAATGSLAIGCDGLRSVARRVLHGDDALRDTGLVAWRAMIPAAEVDDLTGGHASAVHLGPGATFVRYKVRHGALLNCVAIAPSEAGAVDSWSTPSTKAELTERFAGWSEGVHAIIARIPAGALYKWPLVDREPIGRWTLGRMTLLGDAAHPMLPFLGIGATMALEDAVVLARSIDAAATPADGLAAYERDRLPRAVEATLASRRQAAVMQDAAVTDTFRRALPTSSLMDYDVRRGDG